MTKPKKKPPMEASPGLDGLIVRSSPFSGGDSRRLARAQQQEAADRRGRAELLARDRWIGATGRRPRARRPVDGFTAEPGSRDGGAA